MNKLSVLGDVDPEEWKQRPAAVMTESILRQVRPGSIIGLHDPMGAESLQTLENILPALIARGYRFETVSELVRRRAEVTIAQPLRLSPADPPLVLLLEHVCGVEIEGARGSRVGAAEFRVAAIADGEIP